MALRTGQSPDQSDEYLKLVGQIGNGGGLLRSSKVLSENFGKLIWICDDLSYDYS